MNPRHALILIAVAAVATACFLLAPSLLDDERMRVAPIQAAALLKSGILPAERQFQLQRLLIEGNADSGSYAYISELSGLAPVDGRSLGLIPPVFHASQAAGENQISSGWDYDFAIYLPEGPDTASCDPFPAMRHGTNEGVGMRTRFFVAYAWPKKAEKHDLLFAMAQDGVLYSRKVVEGTIGRPPPWNALTGGKGWGAPAGGGWKPFQK